jgi:hypothetical protein
MPREGAEPMMLGDVNLMELGGNYPGKFGLACARQIFTNDELLENMVEPQKKNSRPSLNQDKVKLLKSMLVYEWVMISHADNSNVIFSKQLYWRTHLTTRSHNIKYFAHYIAWVPSSTSPMFNYYTARV